MLGSWPMREHLTHGSPHAEFESCPSDAISPYTANGASRPLHGPPNCLFCAYIRHRVLTGGSESLHFGTECLRRWRCEKTIHGLTATGVHKCMFFSRKVRRKARNAHILTFFANPSYRLSILTRGSSQAEFEALLFESLPLAMQDWLLLDVLR